MTERKETTVNNLIDATAAQSFINAFARFGAAATSKPNASGTGYELAVSYSKAGVQHSHVVTTCDGVYRLLTLAAK